jgi:hypothetical protein
MVAGKYLGRTSPPSKFGNAALPEVPSACVADNPAGHRSDLTKNVLHVGGQIEYITTLNRPVWDCASHGLFVVAPL